MATIITQPGRVRRFGTATVAALGIATAALAMSTMALVRSGDAPVAPRADSIGVSDRSVGGSLVWTPELAMTGLREHGASVGGSLVWTPELAMTGLREHGASVGGSLVWTPELAMTGLREHGASVAVGSSFLGANPEVIKHLAYQADSGD